MFLRCVCVSVCVSVYVHVCAHTCRHVPLSLLSWIIYVNMDLELCIHWRLVNASLDELLKAINNLPLGPISSQSVKGKAPYVPADLWLIVDWLCLMQPHYNQSHSLSDHGCIGCVVPSISQPFSLSFSSYILSTLSSEMVPEPYRQFRAKLSKFLCYLHPQQLSISGFIIIYCTDMLLWLRLGVTFVYRYKHKYIYIYVCLMYIYAMTVWHHGNLQEY